MQLQKIIRIFLILLCALILQGEYSYSQEKLKITHGPYLVEPAENAITVVWFTNKACLSWVEYSGDKSYGTFPTWGGYPKIAQNKTRYPDHEFGERNRIPVQDCLKRDS